MQSDTCTRADARELTEAVPALEYFQGRLLGPDDEDFAERRLLVDRRHDCTPALIAECASVADVGDALRYARTAALPVAVRSGGHSFRGLSTVDDGVVIDVSQLRDVHVDAARRTARIRPGARLGDIARATERYGLAAVTGSLADVGFGGLASVSGRGPLSRRHGHACDNVLSADLMLATGEQLTVSATSDPDLFWALRGAGDSFGVITSFEVALHPIPEVVHTGSFTFAVETLPQVVARLEARDRQISEDCMWHGLLMAPPGGQTEFVVEYTHVGSADQYELDLDLLSSIGVPLTQQHRSCTYPELFHPDDSSPNTGPDGLAVSTTYSRAYLAGCEFDTISAPGLADILLDLAGEMDKAPDAVRSGRMVEFGSKAFGVSREVSPPSVYPKSDGYSLLIQVYYTDAAQDDIQKRFADTGITRLVAAGLTRGGMNLTAPNWTSELTTETVREIFGDHSYRRLQQLKAVWDPNDVFRRSIGIRPAGG
ncbi:FAD-binding oxidoreductase [Gordonia sp. SID5947]|uniref:FAD-binding oxidoreductase n=1 Tax=Gordonia sp. SID5947 TaxID=2690315 RepID=UPI001F36A912|nr:FAD-binding oxidoreductase [Gordonia sp. SID5947]